MKKVARKVMGKKAEDGEEKKGKYSKIPKFTGLLQFNVPFLCGNGPNDHEDGTYGQN